MFKICAKINTRGDGIKYRMFLDLENNIYKCKEDLIEEAVKYDPATSLEEGVWFYIDSFSEKDYAIDIVKETPNPIEYNRLLIEEYPMIDYIFGIDEGIIYFQRISQSKRIVKKKALVRVGNDFRYCEDYTAIPINDSPDAIYDQKEDRLYFRELSHITRIFSEISQVYREATLAETREFLSKEFIVLGKDFGAERVSLPNRKRIALAMKTLASYNKRNTKTIVEYIAGYCPNLKKDEKSFMIKSDDDLKLLLYGIEQRFYTTKVGNEKRIANSVIRM